MKQAFIHKTCLTLLAFSLLPVVASAQPIVWVTDSLRRTGPSDAAGSGSFAQLYAARGEYESFQIAVRGPVGGLGNVNVTVSNLSGPGGAVIPSSAFSLFREKYVQVTPGSVNWNGTNQPLGAGWYPDGLIPFKNPTTGAPITGASLPAVPFSLGAYQNQPIWVDLLVPATATPGAYTGTYTVTANQGSFTGSIALTVWHFTLPLKPSLKSTFVFWTADTLQAEQELLRNKVQPLRSVPSTQSSLINNMGLSTVGIQYFTGGNAGNCNLAPAPSVAQFQAQSALQQPGLLQLDYSVDEVRHCGSSVYPGIMQWAYNMHQAGIKNLATLPPTPALYDDGSGTGHSAVDIWAMLPLLYDQNQSQMAVVLNKGDSLWSYNTLVQDGYTPKWEIDFSPINFRVQPGFINQSLGLTGLLYWRVDAWSSDPWNQVNNVGFYSSNNYPGEGMMLYPGDQVGIPGGVAPSMRLKWVRDGVEDYDYIQMLRDAGQGSWALGLAASVGPNWTNWTRDTNLLQSVRLQLAQKLDQIYGGSGSAPATAPATAPVTAPTAPVTAPVSGAVAPTVTSISPVTDGNRVTFRITVADANGANDLAGAGTMINAGFNGVGGCWFYYNLDTAVVSLASDSTASWASVVQGSGAKISNSQCSIAGTDFGAAKSGNSATITIAVTFNPQYFAGTKSLFVNALDHENASSGYQNLGLSNIP